MGVDGANAAALLLLPSEPKTGGGPFGSLDDEGPTLANEAVARCVGGETEAETARCGPAENDERLKTGGELREGRDEDEEGEEGPAAEMGKGSVEWALREGGYDGGGWLLMLRERSRVRVAGGAAGTLKSGANAECADEAPERSVGCVELLVAESFSRLPWREGKRELGRDVVGDTYCDEREEVGEAGEGARVATGVAGRRNSTGDDDGLKPCPPLGALIASPEYAAARALG